MASFVKNFFSKNKKDVEDENENKVYTCDIEQYDDTFRVPKTILRLVGLRLTRQDSPLVKLCWDVFYWFEFANLFVVTFLELIKMAETAGGGSFQDAVDIFRMMPCVGYLLMAMSKSYKMVVHRPVYENLVSELRAMWPRGPVSKEEHEIISGALRTLNYVVQGYYWCNNALLVIFLSPPFVEIGRRLAGLEVPLILPFFYWFPFDPFQKGYYEVVLAFQTWHGLITIWFMLCGDLLFCVFLSHVTTQFDLVAARARRLVYVPADRQMPGEFPLGVYSSAYLLQDKASVESFSYQDWETRHQKELTEIVQRHHALIRLAGDVERMFSFALLVNFFNSSIILCFCGFCCVIVEKWNEMIYKSFLTTALSQTWLFCWYGQRLLESSEGISDSLYKSGWYLAAKKIKSSIYIMIHRSQKEVHVTTYGFSVICLASYTTIIKSAWSYFTLLLNVYKK